MDESLIRCPDGTLADPSIGCLETPRAIVDANSEILNIILKTADTLMTLAAVASVGIIIYGGIRYALSMGNEEGIKKAKRTLFWSVFGLVVTLLAKYIVTSVLSIIT